MTKQRSRAVFLVVAGILAACSEMLRAQTNLRITSIRMAASNQVEITWSSDSNRWYAVEQGADLLGLPDTFNFVVPAESATPASNRWTGITRLSDRHFYRIHYGNPISGYVNTTTNEGTAFDDTFTVFGTTNTDHVIQRGFDGNDTLYVSGNSDVDLIEQYGGGGNDVMQGIGGTGSDAIFQDGGLGGDYIYGEGGEGNDWVLIRDEGGNNIVTSYGGYGDDTICYVTGDGNDRVRLNVGSGNDFGSMLTGGGDDVIINDCGAGQDIVWIDGGAGRDELTNNRNYQSYAIYDAGGNLMFRSGTNGTKITVMNIEQITCMRPDDTIEWQWP